MKNPGKALVTLAFIFVGISLASLLTPENSAAFPPSDNRTPTSARASAPHARRDEYTLYLPIVFRAPGPIYLPLIARAASPTPTHTPTRTPTPIANPIQNWNFESGHVAWYEDPAGGLVTNNLAGKSAHSGSWGAWLGGEFPPPGEDLVHTLAQQVAIPAGATTLTFWYWIDSLEACGPWDNAWVYIGANIVSEFVLCANNNTGGWMQRSVNIGAYAGQTHWIQFIARVDSDTNSNFLVDDVAIGSATSAPVRAQPPTPTTPQP